MLGFIGLGTMGGAMAPQLIAAGHEVLAFDRDVASCKAFEKAGGHVAAGVEEIARQADIVFLSLPTPAIMKEVAIGQPGLGGGRVRLVIDLSTSGPSASQAVGDKLKTLNIGFADAPVSGGRAGALAGKLSLMLACEQRFRGEVESLLAHFGKSFFVGQVYGQAQMLKLINNIMSVVALAATCEGMALGVKAGLDPNVMLEVINSSSGRNSASMDKFPRAVMPRTFDFGFSTGLSQKDVRLCLEEAERLGVPMITCSIARTMLNLTEAGYGAQADFTNMARLVEGWAGVEIGSVGQGKRQDV